VPMRSARSQLRDDACELGSTPGIDGMVPPMDMMSPINPNRSPNPAVTMRPIAGPLTICYCAVRARRRPVVRLIDRSNGNRRGLPSAEEAGGAVGGMALAIGGGAPNRSARSAYWPSGFQLESPVCCAIVCRFARPSLIHFLIWSIATGPYSFRPLRGF